MHIKHVASIAAITVASLQALTVQAAFLSPDGRGQALIYPYYTVRSAGGNSFNTYVSVVNHSADDKGLRVRVRESRNGREVASINLYLGRNDVWAAAIVPTESGGRLVTRDLSCTDPPLAPLASEPGVFALDFSNTQYSGANSDGAGDGLDRTREGYIEILEMSTLVGQASAGMNHGIPPPAPRNCETVRPPSPVDIGAPSGGISGTLTLINVANGADFAANADALSELSRRSFHRAPSDGYASFDAAEIDPISVAVVNGSIYRSVWSSGIDAVSAALMRLDGQTEYVLDGSTRSQTDLVVTFPTRYSRVGPSSAAVPFTRGGSWSEHCSTNSEAPQAGTGEALDIWFGDRAQRGTFLADVPPEGPLYGPRRICASAAIIPVGPGDPASLEFLTGSISGGLSIRGVPVASNMENGWLFLRPTTAARTPPSMQSLRSSTRIDIGTGEVFTGPHTYFGLPMTGLMLRTFRNGTLLCAQGACQGNYGSALPIKFVRSIASGG